MKTNSIQLIQSINIYDYKPVLEGLIDDFGYTYYHAILSWCEIIQKDQSNKFWEVWLIHFNNKIIGICGLYSLKENNNSELWLGWFGIIPEYRNQKLGSVVLAELENLAKINNCEILYTYVDIEGKPLTFYYRNGFERISTVGEYISSINYSLDLNEFENENDHVLRKKI